MAKNIKRIGIDARFYGLHNRGLGRYTKEIVDNIIKFDQDNEYVIFLQKENFDQVAVDGTRVKKILAPVRWYTLAEQLIMPWRLWRARLDLVHFPHFNVPLFYPGKFVVTIHDLTLFKFSSRRTTTLKPWLYWLKNLAYHLVINLVVRKAWHIIAVSHFTKQDLVSHFHLPPEKISVIYEGVTDLTAEAGPIFNEAAHDNQALLRYNITKPFLLYVGSAYPNKNLERLLKVFAGLRQRGFDWQLAMVGKEDYFCQRLKEQALAMRLLTAKNSPVVFCGHVSDWELRNFYLRARVFIFPSLYEGFGFPPLEAMMVGCPVVSSNSSCLPEILGEAALYFNPEDEADMADKIVEIMSDESLREQLMAKGRERVKLYDWWECARATSAIYQKILLKE